MYLGMLTWPLIALGWVINLFQRGAASMTRLLDMLDAESRARAAGAPRALPPPARRGRTIEFRNVGFHYPRRTATSRAGCFATSASPLPAGATIGVVGATASGKSALMDLIPRLFDPQEGEILIDGVPIRELDLAALRREIGYVPQESFLFSDTIGSNLAYGDTSDADAARGRPRSRSSTRRSKTSRAGTTRCSANAESTCPAARSSAPRSRERWRGKPSIVLLDDALSAVDTHTEAEILRALREALAGERR